MPFSVTSSEITLKGKNRKFFESVLGRNIHASLEGCGAVSVTKKGTSRFLVSAGQEGKAVLSLQKVFGVDTISIVEEVPLDMEKIREKAVSHCPQLKGKKIRVQSKRSNKKFSFESQQINSLIGKDLVECGCTVDLRNPDETVYIDILENSALVSLVRIKGPGGLPVGTSGRVLSLISGGIDSPVASWLMMKRGCKMDFLHMHAFQKEPRDSKIIRLVEQLRDYYPGKIRVYMAPYSEFYKKSMSLPANTELVLFRRFLYKVANMIAGKRRCKGIVTGDSLGQVASQTIQSILLTHDASSLPVFRPLVAFNKDETVRLAEKIGTYQTSLEPYKDCCSLVTQKSPATNLKPDQLKKLEEPLEGAVRNTVKSTEIIEV
ncbi:tRNA 4-thiouridine(8) synthase ThiI [Candidatus Micrarchaeota archaeon]|nr:tRNA 4-thiouridine(8) synthase ThiI [Candidatus Micrarchaeota archaeon]